MDRWRCLNQRFYLLVGGLSVLENFRRHVPAPSETACRTALAGFLFRGDAVHKPAAAERVGEPCGRP
jgi:hypothetical protein